MRHWIKWYCGLAMFPDLEYGQLWGIVPWKSLAFETGFEQIDSHRIPS